MQEQARTFKICAHSSGYIRHTHLHTGFNNTYRHTYIGTHSYVCNLNANITPHVHQTHRIQLLQANTYTCTRLI
jgi:hypothetical protein